MRAGAELGDVGLADDHRTSPPETLDEQCVLHGDVVPIDGRAIGGADAGGVDQVLDGDGEAVERADRLTAGEGAVGGGGLVAGAVGDEGADGVDVRVDALDTGERGGEQL